MSNLLKRIKESLEYRTGVGVSYHKRLDRISINLTWRCPLADSKTKSCPYCWVTKRVRSNNEFYSRPDRPVKDWVGALSKFPPAIFDFVGGEPFFYRYGFTDLVKRLPKKHKYAPTSNVQCNELFRFAEECDPKQCYCFTASYHFSSGMSPEKFTERLDVLRDAGFPVNVNIVNYPPDRHRILDVYAYFQDKRYITHISPYETMAGDYNGTFVCACGVHRFWISNTGDAYRCLSWFKRPDRERVFMGNIFDGTFKRYRRERPCNIACEPYFVYDPTDAMVPDMRIRRIS